MNLHELVAAERARLLPVGAPPAANVSNFIGPYNPGPGPVPSFFSSVVSPDAWADALAANNNLFTTISEWGEITHRLASMPDKPGYDPFRDEKMQGLEDFAYQLGQARSPEQFRYLQAKIAADMDARRRFSEMGPMAQMLMGMVASTGPMDVLPLAAWPRGIIAAGAMFGVSTGVQSAVRHSLAIEPGTIGDVGLDATMAALFGSGYRTLQRLMDGGQHTIAAGRWARAADEAEAAASPVGPSVKETYTDLGGQYERPTVETPRGWVDRPDPADGAASKPFMIVEETDDTRPIQPGKKTDAAGPSDAAKAEEAAGPAIDRPWIIYPDETAAPVDGRRPAAAGDIFERPWIIVPDEGGGATARQVPSTHEIVMGRVDSTPEEPPIAVKATVEQRRGFVDEPAGEAADDVGRLKVERDTSVGAKQHGAVWTADDSNLAPGKGLEALKLTPIQRILNSLNSAVRDVGTALVNHGMVLRGNLVGMASEQSVESAYYAMRAQRITETTQAWWKDFAAYAAARGAGVLNTGSRTLDFAAVRLTGLGHGASYKDFMRQVSEAILAGGQHPDAHVSQAAARFMKLTDDFGREAKDLGYWDTLYDIRRQELEWRKSVLSKQSGKDQEIQRIDRALSELDLEQKQTAARGKPAANPNDLGYLPRYWKFDKIEAHRDRLEAIFDHWITQLDVRDPVTGRPYTGKEAVDILLNIDHATGKPRPFVKPKSDPWAHSAKQQGFDWIPTRAIFEFIETDAEVVLRRYVRQMGIDLELQRRFGDPFMMKEIQALAADGASIAELNDIMFLRDQLRGTVSPMDPHSLMTHSVQAAKYLSNMILLGLQTVTAFTDLARPIMVEGFERTFGDSLRLLSQGMAGIKAWRKEATLLGTAGEIVQSMRAQAFASGSEGRAGTPMWLSGLERAHSAFFMLNGIAPWTDTVKTWATVISAQRIMDVASRIGRRAGAEEDELVKLATIGIDRDMAARIGAQIDQHKVVMGRTQLPNISAWTDPEAARAFRIGLWQSVNRTIITPGAADQARWMVEGTSWLPAGAAQLLAMYHNYGLAVHQKLLLAGLQGADANFLGGALALVSLGWMVDEIRDDMNAVGDRKRREKSTKERLIASIDRSGLLGYMSNINNAIERLSLNTMGIRPTFGDMGFTDRLSRAASSETALVNALGGLGPVGSWAGNLYRVVNGAAHDRQGWAEANAFRRMLPLQNLFWLDGVFDQVQESYYLPAKEKQADKAHQRQMQKIREQRIKEEAGE